MKIDEKDILRGISKGKIKFFKLFYDSYYSLVYITAYGVTKSHSISEDCTQDVFIILWDNRKKLSKVDNVLSYIKTITRNHCIKTLKSKSKLVNVEENFFFDYKKTSWSPEKEFISKEFQKIILDTINNLPNRCKEVFMLIRDKELSYKEVAEMLDISTKTVQAQMQIATKRLKEVIGKYDQNKND